MPERRGTESIELAAPISDAYAAAVMQVRQAVQSKALAEEEWSSLTKHIAELVVCKAYALYRACSNDSVVDALGKEAFGTDLEPGASQAFNSNDLSLLETHGIQVKGRRYTAKGGYGTTGDVKHLKFHTLYAVWLSEDYGIREAWAVPRAVVHQIQEARKRDRDSGKNVLKLPRSTLLAEKDCLDVTEVLVEAFDQLLTAYNLLKTDTGT